MENKDLNAFPIEVSWGADLQNGLTKREWLAGLAMQALADFLPNNVNAAHQAKQVAIQSVRLADELLKELEKVNKL